MDPEFVFENQIEAALWGALGVVLFAAGVRSRRWRRHDFLTAAVRAVFGASDLVEAQTGAWWRPWWLFMCKALCVAALLANTVAYCKRQRAERSCASSSNRAVSSGDEAPPAQSSARPNRTSNQ